MDINGVWKYLIDGDEGDYVENDSGYRGTVVNMCGGRYMLTDKDGEPIDLVDSVYEVADFLINTERGEGGEIYGKS